MSYSSDIKEELCRLRQKNRCCRENTFRAMYICKDGEPFWNNAAVTELYSLLSGELYPELSPDISCGALTDMKYIRCIGCRGALLRGIFLSCGSVSDPECGEYNLDFTIKSDTAADDASELLFSLGFDVRRRIRRGNHVLYIKSSEMIGEFFAQAGANRVMFDIINTRMESDVRNALNRANNTDISNIRKSTDASERACDAVKLLIAAGRFDTLDEKLREAALLRLENPELSIFQLSAASPTPLTKSTLNARLSKIIEIAEKYKAERDG